MSHLDNIKTFVRVYELGNMSAASRDLRISAAVTSSRIAKLENHLGVRLFQRTTRNLSPTAQGNIYYSGACKALESLKAAEDNVMDITDSPRGSLYVAAPLGVGRRLIAPQVPAFLEAYPEVEVRLRLTDRTVDLTNEGLDLAYFLGNPEDSTLRIRKIADVQRVLCAASSYVATRGHPNSGEEIIQNNHECLKLRFPGATEFKWPLMTKDGLKNFRVPGRYECDDADILLDWALDGHGIALKPVFEVAHHLEAGDLVIVGQDTPPEPIQMACLFTHLRHQDPKSRIFMEFVSEKIRARIKDSKLPDQLPR